MKEALARQLAIDYHCHIDEVKGKQNVITLHQKLPGRRKFSGEDSLFRACSVDGKLLVTCDEKVYDWCLLNLQTEEAAWLSIFPNLRKIDEYLRQHGEQIVNTHHYYLTERDVSLSRDDVELVWYEADELEIFRGDNRFTSALGFLEAAPDVLAVAAQRDGEILGMAGCSADSETMWQIGINVTPAGRGLGLGTYLTVLLKNEIIKRDKIPYYGTAETHIKSQKIAVQAGFIPAFAEIWSGKI